MYICKHCNENVEFGDLKVVDLNILHSECVDVYKLELAEARERTRKKWAELGFLDGLKGGIKENIALLYEAQASCVINNNND